MHRSEAAVRIVQRADGQPDTAAVSDMHDIAPSITVRLHGDEAGAQQRLHGFQRVDAITLPGLAGEAGNPAKITQMRVLLIVQTHFGCIAHAAGRRDPGHVRIRKADGEEERTPGAGRVLAELRDGVCGAIAIEEIVVRTVHHLEGGSDIEALASLSFLFFSTAAWPIGP